jgi:hypothetical protein
MDSDRRCGMLAELDPRGTIEPHLHPRLTMAFFRQYIAPLIVVFVFLLALVAASARIFLPSDMAAPAPIEELAPASAQVSAQPAQPQAQPSAMASGLAAPQLATPPGALSPAVFSKKLQAVPAAPAS